MTGFDDVFYLIGHEDTDVALYCRFCDRDALPLAIYSTDSRPFPYGGTDVLDVKTVVELVAVGKKHALEKHKENVRVIQG